jgi:hypothetical protein
LIVVTPQLIAPLHGAVRLAVVGVPVVALLVLRVESCCSLGRGLRAEFGNWQDNLGLGFVTHLVAHRRGCAVWVTRRRIGSAKQSLQMSLEGEAGQLMDILYRTWRANAAHLRTTCDARRKESL